MSGTDLRKLVAGVVVGAAVLQIAFAGVAWYARRAAERSADDERARVSGMEARIEELAQERAAVAATPQPVARWRIADTADVSGTLQAVQEAGDLAGIELTSLRAEQSKTAGRQTFMIAGTGAPTNICAFVAALEQRDNLIVVESGCVLPATDHTIAFELGLATHYAVGREVRR
ncbi:MAG: hypothetical protein U1E73_13055 [Planctomycetota bacterium]